MSQSKTANQDWTGNNKTPFSTIGASNHTDAERQEHDYYATDPIAIDLLAQTGFFNNVRSVLEPACGGGHLAEAMRERGILVTATDLYNHNYGRWGIDFFSWEKYNGDAIVTNPPYKYAREFVEHAIHIGCPKVAMFLKLTFLEGEKRYSLFKKYPPRYVAVCTNRIQCAKNGEPEEFAKSSAVCYGWFIWEKGYKGNPEILFIKK